MFLRSSYLCGARGWARFQLLSEGADNDDEVDVQSDADGHADDLADLDPINGGNDEANKLETGADHCGEHPHLDEVGPVEASAVDEQTGSDELDEENDGRKPQHVDTGYGTSNGGTSPSQVANQVKDTDD